MENDRVDAFTGRRVMDVERGRARPQSYDPINFETESRTDVSPTTMAGRCSPSARTSGWRGLHQSHLHQDGRACLRTHSVGHVEAHSETHPRAIECLREGVARRLAASAVLDADDEERAERRDALTDRARHPRRGPPETRAREPRPDVTRASARPV